MPVDRREPQRTCVGCGRTRAKLQLVRLAAVEGAAAAAGADTGQALIRVDPAGRIPGRGAYLCRETAVECWERAKRKRGLVSRSLHLGHDVIQDSALGDQLRRLNEEHPP